MKRQAHYKLAADCLMVAGLLLAMTNRLTGNQAHELLGTCLLLLFIGHNVMNWRWYTTIPQRWRSNRGKFDVFLTTLFLLALGILVGSSLMISRSLYAFLGMDGSLALRQVHTTAAYWFFILMSMHIGMHWSRVMAVFAGARMLPSWPSARLLVRRVLPIGIFLYGVRASFEREVCSKLFMRYAFDNWAFDTAIAPLFFQNLAIIGVYVVLIHFILSLARYKNKEGVFMRTSQVNLQGKLFFICMLIVVSLCASPWAMAGTKDKPPLLIQEQGSFAVGGSVITTPGAFNPIKLTPEGQTFHGDHAYVFYQIPANARKLPLVLWHGFGQFSKTWETTPDGREGYQNIFLRRGFGVYVIDQPRRGNAGRSTQPKTLAPVTDEQQWFGTFRLGIWPDFFPGVQFSRDPETLNQYFRQMTPDTGPIDIEVNADAVAELFKKIGPGILVTHSHSGGMGWQAAMKSPNIRAIVAYEPGSNFVFPGGEVPPAMPSAGGPLESVGVPQSEFVKLTKIPIILFYGDNIPDKPVANPGQDQWRVRLAMAKLWRDAVNRHGGDVTLVHLPEIGIRGNTHFPFSDMNNLEIADLMSKFLAKKGLQ